MIQSKGKDGVGIFASTRPRLKWEDGKRNRYRGLEIGAVEVGGEVVFFDLVLVVGG